MKKIAMLSTGFGVLPGLTRTAKEIDPTIQIVHYLDDAIIAAMAENNNELSPNCLQRLLHLAQAAELSGAQALLITCSSISEFVDYARPFIRIPIFKIDEPMLRQAIGRGKRIGVMATVRTTLEPTLRQLERLASESGKTPQVQSLLEEPAFQAFQSGDIDLHDALVCRNVTKLCDSCDVVVLAQASIASAVQKLPAAARDKVLSSPRSGIEAVLSPRHWPEGDRFV